MAKKSKAELQAELSQKAITETDAPAPQPKPAKVKKEKAPKAPKAEKPKKEKVVKAKKEPKPKKEKVAKAVVSEVPATGAAGSIVTIADVAPVSKKPKLGIIKQIIAHFKAGKTMKQIQNMHIIDADGNKIPTGDKDESGNDIFETFHPTTISIQVSKYKKANPDIYPPQPPALTKKEIAAMKRAEKEAQAKKAEDDIVNDMPVTSISPEQAN